MLTVARIQELRAEAERTKQSGGSPILVEDDLLPLLDMAEAFAKIADEGPRSWLPGEFLRFVDSLVDEFEQKSGG